MGMNQTPASERVHISFFGKRNAGKSSVINAVTGQNLAIVSQVKGTTTDPVYKTMELLPLGPVMVIDTPGIDDEGELGKLRVKKSYQVLNKPDVALLVVDGTVGRQPEDEMLIQRFQDKSIPYMVVYNKLDLMGQEPACKEDEIWVSAEQETNIWELKEKIARLGTQGLSFRYLTQMLSIPATRPLIFTIITKKILLCLQRWASLVSGFPSTGEGFSRTVMMRYPMRLA